MTLLSLRSSVTSLATAAVGSVQVVRDAFVQGVVPLAVASSGSVESYIGSFGTGSDGRLVASTARLGLLSAVVGASAPPPRVEIDSAEIVEGGGTIDKFSVDLTLSLPSSDIARVSTVRVLRAFLGPDGGAPTPLMSALSGKSGASRASKNPDQIAAAAFMASRIGVGNQVTNMLLDDGFSPQRLVVSSPQLNLPQSDPSLGRTVGGGTLVPIAGLNPSVVTNTTFAINRRTLTSPLAPDVPLLAGSRQGVNVLRGDAISISAPIIQIDGSMDFKEIAVLPIAGISRTVGDFAELTTTDRGVVYGGRYAYVAVCVSVDGVQGLRSRIIPLTISRTTVPSPPSLSYVVPSGCPKFTLRCSGTFNDHIEIFRRGGDFPPEVVSLAATASLVAGIPSTLVDNGFVHIADVGVSFDGAAGYVDRQVRPGQRLDYRFYSVDSFGAKSQHPASCSFVIPFPGNRTPLGLPTIVASQPFGSKTVVVDVKCDDPRVRNFVIQRREVGLKETGFHQPGFPEKTVSNRTLVTKRVRSRSSPVVIGDDVWIGALGAISGAAQLIDHFVDFDRTYQYSVVGTDRRGSNTDRVISTRVFVNVKSSVDVPTALSATVVSSGENVSGVMVTWTHATDDFSPIDLVGDQDSLSATAVRSAFQVERKELTGPIWESFPSSTGTAFFDPVSKDQPPPFRPSYVVVGKIYEYRVTALQSGGFISSPTLPCRVVVEPSLGPPEQIWVRSTPTSVVPFSVVVSWNYSGSHVDRWEVERAEVNKVFAAKLTTTAAAVASGLKFQHVADVPRESSKASAVGIQAKRDTQIYVGSRFFVDTKVSLKNSYFYRVRAVGPSGIKSDWMTGGIQLVDSPHDRKFYSTLSNAAKLHLAATPKPIIR